MFLVGVFARMHCLAGERQTADTAQGSNCVVCLMLYTASVPELQQVRDWRFSQK